MNIARNSLFLILLAACGGLSGAQTIDQESNWFKLADGTDDYNSRFDFSKYSRDDVLRALPIFKSIEKTKATNEWEGVYLTGTAIGEAELRWRSKEGYVFHYVYHTLASLDYGAVVDDPTALRLVSGRKEPKKRSALFADKLIKVRLGKKHYLVPESRLKDFAERAVGRETTHDDGWNYWQRVDETEVQGVGLPIFPAQYSHLTVLPVKTKILRLGRRMVVPSESTTEKVNYDDIYIFVTVSGGHSNGMKRGMDFFIPALGEWVEVVSVGKSRSVGRIRRDFSLEGLEQCWDSEEGSGNPFPCKKLVKGLAAVTRPDDYF